MSRRPLLVIDARMVSPVLDGQGQYVTDLARALNQMPGRPYRVTYLISSHLSKSGIWAEVETEECRSPYLHPSEWLEIPFKLKRTEADLFHSPTFCSWPHLPTPWVQTLHDLNHLTYGSVGKKIYYETVLKSFARRARALVTVSEFSRHEISKWLNRDLNSITLAYNAIEPISEAPTPEAAKKVLSKYGLNSGKYFLCLGNPKSHKNIEFIFKAHLKCKGQAWPLVLNTMPLKESSNPSGQLFLGKLSKEEKQILLIHAGALLSPSLYEGFGRPPLEALVNGIPTLASSIPPHLEAHQILGSPPSFQLLDPKDLGAWTEALQRTTQGGLSRPTLETKRQIMTQFSIENLGKPMDRIYRHVLGL